MNIEITLAELREIAADTITDYYNEEYGSPTFSAKDVVEGDIILDTFTDMYGESLGQEFFEILCENCEVANEDAEKMYYFLWKGEHHV